MLLQDVDDHRAQIHGITTLAENDITAYASTILGEPPERVAAQLREATPAVIATYGEVAAVSGALFYETQRPRPGFSADLVTPADGLDGELGWALAPLFAAAAVDLIPRIAGVVQKYVSNADRQTIMSAAKKDPSSTGSTRYARSGACAFCALMTAQTVDGDHWHNNCKCVEVPTWEDAPAPHSEAMERHSKAVVGARQQILDARRVHPDYGSMKTRVFLAKHPDFAVTNKNLTRVMREEYGFAH